MRGLPWHIGLRYSMDRSGNQLVSFLSRLSMVGLILGVALLVVVLSVMNGFDQEMRSRILALVPHITLQPWQSGAMDADSLQSEVATHPAVTGSAPFLQGNVLLIKGAAVEPALLLGIDPAAEATVSSLNTFVDLDRLRAAPDGLILGSALAAKLDVTEGDRLSLAVPQSDQARDVRFARLPILAVVATGTELDQQLLVGSVSKVQSLLPDGEPLSLRVSIDDVFAAPRIAWELASVHGREYIVRDWTQQFGNMYHAIQMSRKLVVVMLLAVVAVAIFNIVSTLVMVVNDKSADIAILRSQGASRGDILRSFLVYGAVIAGVGTSIGGGLGVVLSLVIGDLVAALEHALGLQLLQSDVYPINYLPSALRWGDILGVCGTAYGMSLIATLYPAWRASRQPPAEALRHG
ncbi:lipoprotein-releasing ABC transporter permease subunit [Spongiibacter taiwanensis]|uniref:lipoprotein-releasing ABC transporter permease subunit n=1 Tax=Spongiibacter taiwanensis TaxID=1748242 RepID=UPI002034B717|nr:lipoprotein-releasing ABC transporter permease subunit [Spongiibacter taiwanensis]USA43518.1 lipoprotein-releasing ABC transporter permease subunit [Spongiibacter taiwanensis]